MQRIDRFFMLYYSQFSIIMHSNDMHCTKLVCILYAAENEIWLGAEMERVWIAATDLCQWLTSSGYMSVPRGTLQLFEMNTRLQ